jgi:hypothetical protein
MTRAEGAVEGGGVKGFSEIIIVVSHAISKRHLPYSSNTCICEWRIITTLK